MATFADPGPVRATALQDQLCFALYAATDAVMRTFRPQLREIGLSYPQYVVMLALWRDGPLAIEALAERTSCPAHAIERVVDRLEAADLVVRLRFECDPRIVRVAPTRAGAELEEAAARAQGVAACRTGLDAEQIAALRATLQRLAASLAD